VRTPIAEVKYHSAEGRRADDSAGGFRPLPGLPGDLYDPSQVRFVDEIPEGDMGKSKKFMLRERALQERAGGAS
jgi:hypothetical protein